MSSDDGGPSVGATGGAPPRALILQHDVDAPAGLLGEWAAARGWELEVVRLDRGEAPPAQGGFARVVSLGSAHSADDEDVAWQAVERDTLRAADAAGVPILGICFGGQALAVALGGGVRRAARPEIGWVAVGVGDGDGGPFDDGPWLEWHDDEMLPPAGAEVLARNASGVQAWRLGPHVGLQFHPEVDERIVGAWTANSRENGRIPADLAAETAALLPAARGRAFALFDALLGEQPA